MGTNADNTMYSVRETDHHPGEPAIVHHSGKALSRAWVGPCGHGERFCRL